MAGWNWIFAAVLTWAFFTSALTGAKQEASRPLIIGGIFERGSEAQDAFRNAITRANRNFKTRLMGVPNLISPNDLSAVNRSVCALLRGGAVAIITDAGSQVSELVRRAADLAEVPHLTLAAWPASVGFFTLRLRPSFDAILKAAFEAPPGPPPDKAAFITAGPAADQKRGVLLRRYPKFQFNLWRAGAEAAILDSLKSAGVRSFYLDLPAGDVLQLLRMARQKGMDLADYTFCIIATDFGAVRGDVAPLAEVAYEMRAKVWMKSLTRLNRPANAMLVMDGVYVLSKALNSVALSVAITPRPITCWSPNSNMAQGTTLMNYLLIERASVGTMTGPLEFDSATRERVRFSFITQNVGEMAVGPTRMWAPPTRAPTRAPTARSITKRRASGSGMRGQILQVVVLRVPPFLMTSKQNGKTVFSGHNIELLKRLARELGFNYTIHLAADGRYGALKNGKWTGMIGELLTGKADLAVGPITLTYERMKVVDFTYSYMEMGLKILTHRPTTFVPSPMAFLQPLTPTVWIVLLVAYVIVSLAIFLIAKLSPFEWHRSSHGSPVRVNEFSFLNAFWFTIGGCLRQYPGLAPRSTSVRVLSAFWWAVVLLFFLYYVCNLYPMLSSANPAPLPFTSFMDIANQNKVKFGCLRGGTTEQFFKDSKIAEYKKIYQRMRDTPGSFRDAYTHAIRDVIRKNGSYAFIGESTVLEQVTRTNCRLQTLPGSINNQGYGFAMPKNSPNSAVLTSALMKLKQEGVTEELELRYFRKKASNCDTGRGAQPFSLPQMQCLFVLLLVGLVLAFVIAILECACNRCCGVGRQSTEAPMADFRISLTATKREIS